MPARRSQVLNPAAALPFLAQSALWFIGEASAAAAIVLVAQSLSHPLRPWPVLPLVAVVTCILEFARRRPFFLTHTLQLLLSGQQFVKKWVARLLPAGLYLLLIFVGGYSLFLIVSGASHTRAIGPDEGAALISASLTFSTAFIAVFIAGAALVIELVSGPYTSGLRVPFARHPIFLSALGAAVLAVLLSMTLLRFGWNDYLLQAVYVWGCLLVLMLPFLLKLFLDYASIPNVLTLYARQLVPYVSRAIPEPATLPNVSHPTLRARAASLLNLRLLYNVHILGIVPSLDQMLPALVVPKDVTRDLTERVRPILNACLRSIREDRRDILLSGTTSLRAIADAYIQARRGYAAPDDEFLIFLAVEVDVLFCSALSARNQQYTADLVRLTGSIGFGTLDLTAGLIDPDNNPSASTFGSRLTEMALRAAHLENTTASTEAIDIAGNLAAALIRQGTLTTGLYGIVDPIAKATDSLAKLPGLWPAALSQRGLHALVKALWTLIDLMTERGYGEDYSAKSVTDSIIGILRSALGVKRDVISLTKITAPVVGRIWQDGNLVDLVAHVLRRLPELPASSRAPAIRRLSYLARVLETGGAIALPAGCASDFASAIAECTWLTVKSLLITSEGSDAQALLEFLTHLLRAAERIAGGYLAMSESRDFDLMFRLSPAYGFLAHYAYTSGNVRLREALVTSLRNLLKAFNATPSDDRDSSRSSVRSYLMMFSSWVYARFPDEDVSIETAMAIAPDLAEWSSLAFHFGDSEFERLGYPRVMLGTPWYIFPSRVWPNVEKSHVEDALNELEAYREYAQIVESHFPTSHPSLDSQGSSE